jgi:hypothetical protein
MCPLSLPNHIFSVTGEFRIQGKTTLRHQATVGREFLQIKGELKQGEVRP